LIIVLDSNEYINHLNRKDSPDILFSHRNLVILINDHIIREVIRNLDASQAKEFYNILFNKNIDFYGEKLPSALLENFKRIGLKKGDITIAAFCEHIRAEHLITENRHFLKDIRIEGFQVLSMREFVKKMR